MDATQACMEIAAIILRAEDRCMAADGPVGLTSDEITEDELRSIYDLAQRGAGARSLAFTGIAAPAPTHATLAIVANAGVATYGRDTEVVGIRDGFGSLKERQIRAASYALAALRARLGLPHLPFVYDPTHPSYSTQTLADDAC